MPTKKKTSDSLKGADLVKAIELAGREKNLTKDSLYDELTHALREAAARAYGKDEEIEIHIDRAKGSLTGRKGTRTIDPEALARFALPALRDVVAELVRRQDTLKLVELMHREKNIPKEVIFNGIEAALLLAAQKHFDADEEEDNIQVSIDRDTGRLVATHAGDPIDPDTLGRISAQAAKQHMIQKIREAECDAQFKLYAEQKGDLVRGVIQRFEGGIATVSLGKAEAILPRSEQIRGETHHVGETIKAVILEVRKVGHRVKIVLSRNHPDFVRRLFEIEIPEIAEKTIEIRAIAREAGYRTKIAVSSIDSKVDCVGACVGVRGSRIKNIVDELGGERIDIVRWNDALQVLIPNALQPASIEEVFLYNRLGRAIVLVQDDQLSLAIGRGGQNVRLASKLVGWDIEIMTHDEYNEELVKAETWFTEIPGVTTEMVEAFIEEGFLSFDDLTFLEPYEMAELTGLTDEQAEDIISYAEEAAERVEEETRVAKATAGPSSPQPSTLRPTPQEQAAALLGAPKSDKGETRPTFTSLFPDEPPTPVGSEEPASEASEESPTSEAVEEPAVEQVSTSEDSASEQPEVESLASSETEQEQPSTSHEASVDERVPPQED